MFLQPTWKMNTVNIGLCISAIVCSLCAFASAVPLDTLIQGISSADPKTQCEARQLLPRENPIEAVPKLLPLVGSDNPSVWWTALAVLSDLANKVTQPGYNEAQGIVTTQLMTLLDPAQSNDVKIRVLRILPIVIPEGYDVGPVAALLTDADPGLREKAREALEVTGTLHAAEALCNALAAAPPDFQAAILFALARMEKTLCLETVLTYTRSKDATVRAAAAHALAWTGNPEYLPTLESVWKSSDETTAFDACDAYLRLADAMVVSGGKWELAMSLYRQVLKKDLSLVHRSGAIAGLGRYGDESVLDDIMNALKGADARELEPAVLAAFDSLQGAEAGKQLLALYPNLPDSMKLGMLGIFGRKQDPLFLDTLNSAAKSDDSAFRKAALAALGDSQLPGAVQGIVAIGHSGSAEDKAAVTETLKRMASVLRARDDKQGAGKAFLELYRFADTDELRQEAMDGIKQFPIPEAFDVIMQTMNEEERANLPPAILLGLAKTLNDAGRAEDGKKLLETALTRIDSAEALQEAFKYLGPDALGMAPRLGVITAWHMVGPFPWDMNKAFSVINVNEPNVDLNASYTSDGKTLTWKKVSTGDPGGLIDLAGNLAQADHVCGYAFAKISVPEACDIQVRTGSDDGIKVWVNRQVVTEQNVDRPTKMDSEQNPAKLNAGENSILVECTQNAGGWNFCLRLTKADGAVLSYTPVE
ncbi:MAG TPA: HEAT repeat domain-containing protein [Candidatus Hydrogenedentes bacterium]|nr:HEAT repeat domain-containing protein [Candidatus Hydrogenedentota bacterium]